MTVKVIDGKIKCHLYGLLTACERKRYFLYANVCDTQFIFFSFYSKCSKERTGFYKTCVCVSVYFCLSLWNHFITSMKALWSFRSYYVHSGREFYSQCTYFASVSILNCLCFASYNQYLPKNWMKPVKCVSKTFIV